MENDTEISDHKSTDALTGQLTRVWDGYIRLLNRHRFWNLPLIGILMLLYAVSIVWVVDQGAEAIAALAITHLFWAWLYRRVTKNR